MRKFQFICCLVGLLFLSPPSGLMGEMTAEIETQGLYFEGSWEPAFYGGLSGGSYLYSGELDTLRLDFSGNILELPYGDLRDWGGQGNVLFTKLQESWVLGVQLEALGSVSMVQSTEYLAFSLSVPFTWNSTDFSLFLSPVGEINPLVSGYVGFGVNTYVSFMLSEFVFKPSFYSNFSIQNQGGKILSIGPGLKFSWYPGFPLSLEFKDTIFWITDSLGGLIFSGIDLQFFGVVSPVDWLLLSLDLQSEYNGNTIVTAGEAIAEYMIYLDGEKTLSFPVSFRYQSQDFPTGQVGVGLRFSF